MSGAGFSPAVLKNRGVPLTVHSVVPDGDGQPTAERVLGPGDEPVMEGSPRYIRLDNNILSDIEDPTLGWGSVDTWEEDLVKRPFQAIRRTLALCWGFDPTDREALRVVGAICPDDQEWVGVLIGAAYMLAMGTDPEAVGKAVRQSEQELAVDREKEREVLRAALENREQGTASPSATSPSGDTPTEPGQPESAGSRGTSGSAVGSPAAAALTSSGD